VAKKKKSPPRAIRDVIRENVWYGRDDKLHGVAVAADIIDREVVEEAYQEGFTNAQDPGKGFVRGVVTTSHPENYLLVNIRDATYWSLNSKGRWIAAAELVVMDKDGKVSDVLKLGKKAS